MEAKQLASVDKQDQAFQEPVCPICYTTDISRIIDIAAAPIHCNILWPTREEAVRSPKGDIQLRFCQNCGHIFNPAFQPELMAYTQAYENSLHFSPQFQDYAATLAKQLIEHYDLYDKEIIEIGCGKGEFLKLLCEAGQNRGIGFDPSYVPEQIENSKKITFIQDFYSTRYANYQADLICCRHVLEHIQHPHTFLAELRLSIGHRLQTQVFFEVPNVLYTLKDLGIWDLIYEHCSYFGSNSLAYLFTACGFRISRLTETYGKQFLCIEAAPVEENEDAATKPSLNLEEMASLVAIFADKYEQKVAAWRNKLSCMQKNGQRVVTWGGGSKGVTFLNLLETQNQIEYVVDLNPRKQGMYITGTGQQIVPPEFLKEYRPDLIVVMNPMYTNEIQQMIDNISIEATLIAA